jgi:hypothetical protein
LGKEQDKINRLEAKLQDRNEAPAELMEEDVRLKKRALGDLKAAGWPCQSA